MAEQAWLDVLSPVLLSLQQKLAASLQSRFAARMIPWDGLRNVRNGIGYFQVEIDGLQDGVVYLDEQVEVLGLPVLPRHQAHVVSLALDVLERLADHLGLKVLGRDESGAFQALHEQRASIDVPVALIGGGNARHGKQVALLRLVSEQVLDADHLEYFGHDDESRVSHLLLLLIEQRVRLFNALLPVFLSL